MQAIQRRARSCDWSASNPKWCKQPQGRLCVCDWSARNASNPKGAFVSVIGSASNTKACKEALPAIKGGRPHRNYMTFSVTAWIGTGTHGRVLGESQTEDVIFVEASYDMVDEPHPMDYDQLIRELEHDSQTYRDELIRHDRRARVEDDPEPTRKRARKPDLRVGIETPGICTICLGNRKIKLGLHCGHAFHKGCITKWARANTSHGSFTCPTCREPTWVQ